jgi:F-type H+-transporting ATPase subunit b
MIISQALAATAGHAGEHSVFQDPTFWVGIAFCITVFTIFKLAGKTISALLQARADKIAFKLEETSKLRAEAERLLAEYAVKHAKIGQTTQDALEEAVAKAQNLKENIQNDFEEKLKNREEAAYQRLDRAREEASEEIRNLAVSIAMRTVERILSEKLSGEDGQRLINEAIDSLPELFSKETAA